MTLTEDDICDAALHTFLVNDEEGVNGNDDAENDDGDTDDDELPPTEREMIQALNVLRRGVQRRSDERGFNVHYEYEEFIQKILMNSKVQSTMDRFIN